MVFDNANLLDMINDGNPRRFIRYFLAESAALM